MISHFRKEAMKAFASAEGHEVFASFDYLKRDGRSVGQKFVSFADYGAFVDAILSSEQACFYEMVREGCPCKMYFDVEWMEQSQGGRAGALALRDVQLAVADVFSLQYAGSPLGRCVVLKGSRATERGFKHSYHLIYPAVVFACNNGALKQLAQQVGAEVARRFGVRAVDGAVYTKDRAFRVALCYKLSDRTQTRLLWGEEGPADVRAAVLESMVCFLSEEQRGACIQGAPPHVASVKAAVRGAGRASAGKGVAAADDHPHGRWVPLMQKALQSFLQRHGGAGVVDGGRVFSRPDGAITFRYNHRAPGCAEPCLAHGPGGKCSHRRDNQFVTLTADSFVI
eukprot:3937520-Rhodomonas_salina.2